MQKYLLWLFCTVMLSLPGLAQTNSLPAKWTDDQRAVLESLPATGQSVVLALRPDIKMQPQELKATCEKMSNELSTWKMSEDGDSFVIRLGRDFYPQWTQKEWENYINRLLMVNFPKG